MENNEEILYEDVLSEEYLDEMVRVIPAGNCRDEFSIILIVNPDNHKLRNPYFKLYNNTSYDKATKVARISFIRAELITDHAERNGKQEMKLNEINSSLKDELMEYLNSPSGANPNVSVWTLLRYKWNEIKGYTFNINDYIAGEYDIPENMKNENYVPFNIQIPDYLNNLHNDKE